MKRFCIIVFLFFNLLQGFGQTRKIENLKQTIHTSRNPKLRLKALINLLDQADNLNEDSLWNYSLMAKGLAKDLNDGQAYSMAVLGLSRAYLKWDNVDSARALIEPELAKYNPENPKTRKIYFELAQTRFSIVGNNSNYKAGMAYVFDVMRKAERYKDSLVIGNCMNTLAAWKYDLDFLAESRAWDYKALSYTNPKDPRFYPVLIGIYNTIGDNYRWIKNIDSANYFISKAIELTRKTDQKTFLAYALERMTSIYVLKKNYPKAEKTIEEAIQIVKSMKINGPVQEFMLVQSSVYEHAGQLNKAIKVLNDGLKMDTLNKKKSPHASRTSNSTDLSVANYYQELAKCYRLKGDQKMYASTLQKILDRMDAFYKANSADAIAELETKYEVEKKEATIARQNLNLTRAGYFLWGSILFAILSGIIIWLVFRDYRRKQDIKLKQLQEEEKRLAMEAVAEAEEIERKRIAADLHDNLGAQLSFIKRNVNYIIDQPQGFNPSDEKKYLGYVKDIAQNAMIDLRETIWVLHKDEVTIQEFADKLKSYLRQQLLDKDMIRLHFEENIGESWMLTSGEVMHLFRIVQEIVSNAIKHSNGNKIEIKLSSEKAETYQLIISDNGKGFNVDQVVEGHYGMENIQKRARDIKAELILKSEPGTGTTVWINKGENTPFVLYKGSETSSTFIE